MKDQLNQQVQLNQPVQLKQATVHPIGLYLKIWFLLFVLSTCSYLVDYFEVQGYLRWGLILIFMVLKAGLILAVFMHVNWERLTVKLLLFLPPIAIMVLITLNIYFSKPCAGHGASELLIFHAAGIWQQAVRS